MLVPQAETLTVLSADTGQVRATWSGQGALAHLGSFRGPRGRLLLSVRQGAEARVSRIALHRPADGAVVWERTVPFGFANAVAADLDGDGADEVVGLRADGWVQAWAPVLRD